jgi:hypothetical protein
VVAVVGSRLLSSLRPPRLAEAQRLARHAEQTKWEDEFSFQYFF